MEDNKKVVLICENSGHKLNVVDKENYILEGVFCVFGKENVNNRIYEEDEYFPHLDYLQEKVKKNKLLGELDHPEKFDVSLQKVSHIVEKLWYDKPSRTLKGRIRVLDTEPHGINARKLVNAGFPISISSRAAGVVQENKKVKIKRIFAYDFVADGGFGDDAEMKKISESLNFNYETYNKPSKEMKLINEELGFKSEDNIKIYNVTDEYPAFLNEDADYSVFDYSIVKNDKKIDEELIYNKNKNNMSIEEKNKDFVSADEMYKYSLHVKDEVTRIDKNLKEINEKISMADSNKENSQNEKLDNLTEEIKMLREKSEELDNKMKNVYKWSDEISEDHNWLTSYVEEIAEDHNNLANYTEKVVEDHNHLANYTEKTVEDHNHLAAYVDESLRPLLEKTVNYANLVAEKANIGLNYIEDVVVNEIQNTQDFVNEEVVEKLNTVWNYAEYLGEKNEEIHQYSDYLGKNAATREDVENVANYSESIKESSNQQNINENENTINKYKSLGNKIDNILHSVQTEKINENNQKYPILNNLNREQSKKFFNFTEIQKEQIEKSLTPSMKSEEINKVFESVEKPIKNEELWLTYMPEDVKPLWEKADENVKQQIKSQAQLYSLPNEYSVRHFWSTRMNLLTESDLGENEQILNESKKTKKEESKLGYSSDYMKNVFAGLDRFNK